MIPTAVENSAKIRNGPPNFLQLTGEGSFLKKTFRLVVSQAPGLLAVLAGRREWT
jgi:hypothetical protein